MKYKKIPGKNLKTIGKLNNNQEPTITIITPFYNGEKTLMQTANSIFSQTYPYFEWVIINDGSTSPDSPKALKELSKMDSRVRVLNKENGGPSQARDYGISKANPSTKYIYFIDCDDIIENNMLEMMYWTLETHKEASFVYPSIINFGAYKYYWEPYYTIEEEVVNNVLCINTMIRKDDLLEVGCFEIKEKAMYEDWNLWLKLLAKEKTPIRINPQSFWYRTSTTGELSRARSNDSKAMKLIRSTAKKVKKEVPAIQYPRMSVDYTTNTTDNMILPDYNSDNSKLFIIKDTTVNKSNILAYETIKRLSEKTNVTVVATEPYYNQMRQDIQEYSSEFFDMSNFLDYKDYPLFVNYLINSRKIDEVVVIDDTFGYALIPTIKEFNDDIKVTILMDKYNDSIKEYSSLIENVITTNDNTNNELKNNNIDSKYIKIEKISKTANEKLDNLKKKYNVPVNKKVISWIDNVSCECRPQVFIEIANKLRDNDDLFFIMSGEGQMEKDINKLIEKYDLTEKIILIEEQEDINELIKISDIVVKTSAVDGTTAIGYMSVANGVQTIVNDIENPSEYIPEECGKIVEYIDTKTTDDFINYAGLYVEKINEILENYDKCKTTVNNYSKNLSQQYDNVVKEIIEISKNKANNNTKVFNSSQLYNYKTIQLKEQFRSKYLNYYKEYHHIVPRETVDNSKAAIYKRKIRSFSIKTRLENEMHYVFLKTEYLGKAIKGFVEFIKNTVMSLIFLIPCILVCFKILLRLIHILLAKIKHLIIK